MIRASYIASIVASLLAGCTLDDPDPSSIQLGDIETDDVLPKLTIGTISQGEEHASANSADAPAPITYHGGPVLLGTTNVYFIWYGNWAGNTAKTILPALATHLGGSPYFGINTTYYDGTNAHVTNAVHLVKQIADNYTHGKTLSDGGVAAVVATALSTNKLPVDSNALYVVFTSADVSETSGFCTAYCGWHTVGAYGATPIHLSFIGNADRCPSACSAQAIGPNGNAGADAMASVFAHELAETVTDPRLDAWFDANGAENADKCAWTFGATYTTANNAAANVKLGGKDYLLQRNWLNTGAGSCALSK